MSSKRKKKKNKHKKAKKSGVKKRSGISIHYVDVLITLISVFMLLWFFLYVFEAPDINWRNIDLRRPGQRIGE